MKAKSLRSGEIDAGLVPPMWNRAVYANPEWPEGVVDRDAYVVCVLEQLRKALRVRDVFAVPSYRWGDPRARLLAGPAWEAVCPEVLGGLGLAAPVHEHLHGQVRLLDAAWAQMADRLDEAGDTASVRIRPGRRGSHAPVGGVPGRSRSTRSPKLYQLGLRNFDVWVKFSCGVPWVCPLHICRLVV